MNRTPPKVVQEALRNEVNYGCPVNGCGSTYLTWHHFNPPWAEKHHHNLNGLIALCAEHASQADGNRFTRNQLWKMKKEPYVSSGKISEYYGYLRKKVVCFVGNIAYNVVNVLEINGERVIGFRLDDEGYYRLNLLIKDETGKPILVMEDNYWTAISSELFDLHCSAQGKVLEIVSKDKKTNFSMRFDDYSIDSFKEKVLKLSQNDLPETNFPTGWSEERKKYYREQIEKTLNANNEQNLKELFSAMEFPLSVPTWTIKGILKWGKVHIRINETQIEDLINHNTFGMNFIINGRTGLKFDEKSTSIGG